MMLRRFSVAAGLVIIASAAHVTVQATGGYQTPHAVLTIAIAGGVGVGALAIGGAWSERRYTLALLLCLALACGELFGLLQTGERLITAREYAQAPARAILATRAKASQHVAAARDTLSRLPAQSTRLVAALAAKSAADTAVLEKSALRGCASNCRKLLEAQVSDANAEVAAALAAHDRHRQRLGRTLSEARAAFAAIKLPASATGLADRLGLPPWALDIVVAGLGSIAANGLGCLLLAFGAHRPRRLSTLVMAPAVVPSPIPQRRAVVAKDHCRHMSDFAVARMVEAAGARISLNTLHTAYKDWCAAEGLKPLPTPTMAELFAELFEHTKTPVDIIEGEVFALDVIVKPASESREMVVT